MTKQQILEDKRRERNIGYEGELFVLKYERKRLPKHLASMVYRLGEEDIAHGYDILSCKDENSIGLDRYIEVKTYLGHPHFYLSENELESARSMRPNYCVYLVDYNRIKDPTYQPTIIDNPLAMFKEESPWSVQINTYYFSLDAQENIPENWDESTVMVGCYRDEEQLEWIKNQSAYNVRLSKDLFGAVDKSNTMVTSPRYLILYSSANQHIYYTFRLTGRTGEVTLKQMTDNGYTAHRNDPSVKYLVYEIDNEIPSFHIQISRLTRQLGRWKMEFSLEDLLSGTPIYAKGSTLRYYMEKSFTPTPKSTIDKRKFAKDMYPNYGKPWNEEAVNQVIALYHEGLTFSAISDATGRAPWTIEQKLRELRYSGQLKPKNRYIF